MDGMEIIDDDSELLKIISYDENQLENLNREEEIQFETDDNTDTRFLNADGDADAEGKHFILFYCDRDFVHTSKFAIFSDDSTSTHLSRKKKKRSDTKRILQKTAVERGMKHLTKSGKIIEAKNFSCQTLCRCDKGCGLKIDVVRQKEIYDAFYNTNWSSKTAFIRSCVRRIPIKTKMSDLNPVTPAKNVQFHLKFHLINDKGTEIEVCRWFFYKLLQVNKYRCIYAIKTAKENPSSIDSRGHRSSVNKIKESDMNYLRDFISKFPKYESHYGRSASKRMYLSPNLNIIKMFKEYRNVCEFHNRPTVSETTFRKVFNFEFNLAFKTRKKDTCKQCDKFEIEIKSSTSYEKTQQLEKEKNHHFDHVNAVKNKFKDDVKFAENAENKTICLTFDLQKTLETPVLTTNVAYYKRSLWTYNLCIYNESEKKGYMYIWSENMGSRGACDIGTCLIKHFEEHVSPDIKHIILYSDGCGGQNRNIKLTLLFKKYLCQSIQSLQSIHQKYFVSGHSYNNCDRCFALIEKQKKLTQEIFVPDDWTNLIRQAKKKEPQFEIHSLDESEFLSTNELLPLIVNRKKSINGFQINWFKISEIINRKAKTFSLIVIQGNIEHEIDISRKGLSTNNLIQENWLRDTRCSISKQKYDDLVYLTQFMPERCRDFYKQMQHDGSAIDYGLASGSSGDES